MFAGHAYANEPWAGASNLAESISVNPASPYTLTQNIGITPIDVTCDDLDSGVATTLSLVSGTLPTGLSFSQTLPYTAAVPFTVSITGTPTVVENKTIVLRNDDGEGTVAETTLVLDVQAGAPPINIGGNLLGIVTNQLGVMHGGRGRYGKF